MFKRNTSVEDRRKVYFHFPPVLSVSLSLSLHRMTAERVLLFKRIMCPRKWRKKYSIYANKEWFCI